jgi:glutamine synthetase
MLRETIRGVSLNYGLKASLAPKPFAEQAGSGCHLHFSLWDKKTGRNITAEDASGNALSAKANNFLAGILNHLEAIVAISCASVNSYRRLRPQSWSSAFAFWGYENREAALRIPSTYWGVEAESANVELKCVDASSNPYLLLAAVIAAGLDGISHNLQLGEPYAGDPAVLTPNELKERGIRQLPHNLEIALEYLEKDKVLCAALGEDLIKTFIRVKRSECVEFQSKDIDFELENHRFKF